MTTLKPHPEYKDSAVDWLGDIPITWDTRAAKRMLREVSDKGYPNLPLLAATQSHGVVTKDRYGQRTVIAMSNLESLKRVQIDDFVISLRSFQGGIERAYDEGIISSAYTVLRHDRKLIDVGYLARLFKSRAFISELELNVTGIREGQNINYGTLRESKLPLPPLYEQRAIADFLDIMDARISRFIAAKRRMIALLEEKKQAVINQAITRGLDPDVPLKDSGVDWLGKIPAHWEVRRIKSIARETDSRSQTGEEELLSLRMREGLVPHALVSDKPIQPSALVGYKRVRQGQLVMNRMRASVGLFAVAESAGLVSPDYAIFNLTSIVEAGFLVRLLKTPMIGTEFRKRSSGLGTGESGFLRLYTDDFGNVLIPVPPHAEQRAIVDHLHREAILSDAVLGRARRETELIQEYRTRLISDVVTGKLDVRGVELPAIVESVDAGMEEMLDEGASDVIDAEAPTADSEKTF